MNYFEIIKVKTLCPEHFPGQESVLIVYPQDLTMFVKAFFRNCYLSLNVTCFRDFLMFVLFHCMSNVVARQNNRHGKKRKAAVGELRLSVAVHSKLS